MDQEKALLRTLTRCGSVQPDAPPVRGGLTRTMSVDTRQWSGQQRDNLKRFFDKIDFNKDGNRSQARFA